MQNVIIPEWWENSSKSKYTDARAFARAILYLSAKLYESDNNLRSVIAQYNYK